MGDYKEVKYDKKGYTVVDVVDTEGQAHRRLPNSDPGRGGGNYTYQKQPWDTDMDQDD